MKAVVYDRYGPPEVLRIEERAKPVPKPNEVLVKVRASTVNRTDTAFRGLETQFARLIIGFRRPKPGLRAVGRDFAGDVEAVGAAVTQFAPGDRVFGIRQGANADYVCVREQGAIARIPDGMGYEEAAALPDGFHQAAAHLKRGPVGPETRLLVYGATGSCGTASVQLAKHLGAHVTAVGNTKNVELVRSLGADVVIDYLEEDFTKRGETYDVILDAVGKHSFFRSRRALKPRGVFIATDRLHNLFLVALTLRSAKKVVMSRPVPTKEALLVVKELVEAGKYRPVIDRSYPLEEVVEAHRYVEKGEKTGNVVLIVNEDGSARGEGVVSI
jgi:NADPH:quinone reductase-like Zn-dependent oxidoreductase